MHVDEGTLPSLGRLERRRLWTVGVVALVAAAFYITVNLIGVGFDPAGLVQFGEEDAQRAAYAEEQFGREIALAPDLGHDGRFFFIQAMDPWMASPSVHAIELGRPIYRSQRMLYPMLASLGGLLGPDGIVIGMILTQVIFFVVGTVLTGRLAQQFGLSPLWGLVFAFNPGVRFELEILGAGVLGMALVVGAIDAYYRERGQLAVVLGSMAVLTREVLWLSLVGVAFVTFTSRRRDAITFAVVPSALAVLWGVFVRLRLGGLPTESTIQELGLPFRGIVDAVRTWSVIGADMSDVALVTVTLLLIVAVLASAVSSRSPLLWSCVGFAVLAPLLSGQVWLNGFDVSRAVSPVFTFYALHLGTRLMRTRPLSTESA